MTGLDLAKDHIVEIACIVTDKNLKILDEVCNLFFLKLNIYTYIYVLILLKIYIYVFNIIKINAIIIYI